MSLTSGAFLNKNDPLNKPAMNNRRILVAAVFHFVDPVKKAVLKTHCKMTQKSLSIDYHLELSVNKFPDAALIFRMNSPVKF